LILLDTSGVLSALFPDQRWHEACAAILRADPGPFLLSPFVLAELDHLIAKLAGVTAETAFLDEVARRAYELAPFGAEDVEQAREVVDRHADQAIGLADASIVVLSHRHRVNALLTLDERHFRVLTGAAGRPFGLLPADR
jgi:predicted nucleic acid-binding protein